MLVRTFFYKGLYKMNYKNTLERLPETLFLMFALITALVTICFILFIFYQAIPVFQSQGFNYLLSSVWDYGTNQYGIRTYIGGTIMLTMVTLALAVPLGVFTAIFLAEYASSQVASVMRPLIEMLVGIPSVVYGIFGLIVLEDIFQNYIDVYLSKIFWFSPFFQDVNPSMGDSLLLAATVLAIMILPTITTVAADSMRSVSKDYKEASYSLGATHWETIRKVVLPTASSGILAGIVLGLMRAMGETMAIVMLYGNSPNIPSSLLDTGFAMTSKILNDITTWLIMDQPRSALFGIAAVLFGIEIIFVFIAKRLGGEL